MIPATHLPLAAIAEKLDPPITAKQLKEYGRPERRKGNGFPDPARQVGRYVFFDRVQVQEWWSYYSLAITNMHPSERRS